MYFKNTWLGFLFVTDRGHLPKSFLVGENFASVNDLAEELILAINKKT